MSRVLSFFREEAADQLAGMRASLRSGDAAELYRYARVLRGSAQMARQESVRELAMAVEATARRLARDELDWSDTVRRELAGAADELERRVAHAQEQAPEQAPEQQANQWTESEEVVEDQGIVPIRELQYAGDRALARARELRGSLEEYIEDPDGLELLAELYDLIELGRA
ncbi:MAG TPA: Hpt domain-containing protein [Longimicrobiales bacterium]|nr:Hpt domain-containing protein [Longimicrobiales bacterium]